MKLNIWGGAMVSIFDRSGKQVGWMSGNLIVNLSGEVISQILENCVFKISGNHIGWYQNGYFWNLMGNAIAFDNSAIHGPHLPITDVEMVEPVLHVAPVMSVPQVPYVPPVFSLNWGFENLPEWLK